MGVTNYISMDGMLIGEVTSGIMRNYGTDALGSVVETVLNGVEENTYQYSPFGRTLAKTGSGADPYFLWNGRSGYMATSLLNAEAYVRSRHYSSNSGQWTTVDSIWPAFWAYAYVGGRVTRLVDPSGMAPASGNCGGPHSKDCPPQCISGPCKTPLTCGMGDAQTGCNSSKGATYTILCNCGADAACSGAHEAQHRADDSTCCTMYALCVAQGLEPACTNVYVAWLKANTQYLECRAYAQGQACRNNLWAKNNCDKHPHTQTCIDICQGLRTDNYMLAYYGCPVKAGPACVFPNLLVLGGV